MLRKGVVVQNHPHEAVSPLPSVKRTGSLQLSTRRSAHDESSAKVLMVMAARPRNAIHRSILGSTDLESSQDKS